MKNFTCCATFDFDVIEMSVLASFHLLLRVQMEAVQRHNRLLAEGEEQSREGNERVMT